MTELLDLPDELLCCIVRCFRAGNNYDDWTTAQCFMRTCKRIQYATRHEPWAVSSIGCPASTSCHDTSS